MKNEIVSSEFADFIRHYQELSSLENTVHAIIASKKR